MSKLKSIWRRLASGSARISNYVDENKADWGETASRSVEQGGEAVTEFARGVGSKAREQSKSLYLSVKYSKDRLQKLEKDIENQGAAYREVLRSRRLSDTIFVGGESLATLLAANVVSSDIEAAYSAAYPDLAAEAGFLEHARILSEEQLLGFISGIKGKLFEQQYAEYLNGGVLPDGYTAELASTPTQLGWDIVVYGPNQEVAQLLQAKATDSVGYVQDAIAAYPSIDVVTTDEVYGHLVMAGVSENITAGGISNQDLTEYVESTVSSASLDIDFIPPEFTLAFIAFTSYRDQSLTLYEKARSAGDRTAKAYLGYIIGGGVAVATSTWWIGVLGSVSSRYLSDEVMRKAKLIEAIEKTKETNQAIIDRIRARRAAV